ncbi:rRNA-processing protein UTP23 homolog [Clavelina lepadiformis]|uniref:UTP23 sensor motif region domain-containing protein n=1 Tax=Clavelina lepadiformis TaxID=159417 RepID=A0ABP0GIA2_CLALP
MYRIKNLRKVPDIMQGFLLCVVWQLLVDADAKKRYREKMKIKRQKQARHNLSLYRNIFKFHEPYLILIDGTFCQASLKHNIFIKEQLSKYLQCKLQCCTTRCVLAELDLLGSEMYGAKIVAQRFQLRSCAHKDKPVPASQCLQSLIGEKNDGRYLMATQDPTLTKVARSIPGVPVLYIFQSNIVLDKPSRKTIDYVKDLSKGKILSQNDVGKLSALKKDANLAETNPSQRERRKRKRAKGPNPLSCKKKKTKQQPTSK